MVLILVSGRGRVIDPTFQIIEHDLALSESINSVTAPPGQSALRCMPFTAGGNVSRR